jgi:hypothetical protein
MGKILTSFLDGFALAGFFARLRRRGAPTHAFAPSRPKEKMVIVIDDDQAVESLEGLRRGKPNLGAASYSHIQAEVYIRDSVR